MFTAIRDIMSPSTVPNEETAVQAWSTRISTEMMEDAMCTDKDDLAYDPEECNSRFGSYEQLVQARADGTYSQLVQSRSRSRGVFKKLVKGVGDFITQVFKWVKKFVTKNFIPFIVKLIQNGLKMLGFDLTAAVRNVNGVGTWASVTLRAIPGESPLLKMIKVLLKLLIRVFKWVVNKVFDEAAFCTLNEQSVVH